MSKYSTRHLNDNVKQGFLDEKLKAWHFARISVGDLKDRGIGFDGPVPIELAEKMLGYTPVERRVYVEGDDGIPELVADRKAIVLPESVDCPTFESRVAYVGSDGYAIHDVRKTVLENVVTLTEAGADLATVGKLGGGRLAFTSWRPIEGRVEIPGFSGLQAYINAGTSTDGTLATTVHTSTTLQVCDNTAGGSLRRAEQSGRLYRVRHTSQSSFDVDEARKVIDIAVTNVRRTAKRLEDLANVTMSEADWFAILNGLLPVPEDEGRAMTICMNRRGELNSIMRGDPRVPTTIHGTLLAAWQTFNTQQTWGFEVRGNKDPVGRQWERTLRSKSTDDQFWDVVASLGIAPTLSTATAPVLVGV